MDTRMSRTCPVEGIIGFAGFVSNLCAFEERIDGGRIRCVRRTGIIHDALQFLDARQPPIIVAKIFFRVLFLDPGERILPVHTPAAVRPGPHQAGSAGR